MRVLAMRAGKNSLYPLLLPPWCIAVAVGYLGIFGLIVEADEILSWIRPHPASQPTIRADTVARKTMIATTIATLNLFGKIAEAHPFDLASIPTTTLNLKLACLFVSSTAKHSRALIADGGNAAKTFYRRRPRSLRAPS